MYRCFLARAAWLLGVALALAVNTASALESFYDSDCTASGCHNAVTATNTRTCTGCHYHASHPTVNGIVDVTSFNLKVTTDKTSYTVGDTITVSVSGGNKSNDSWFRLRLYDAKDTILASCNRSTVGGCSLSTKLTARAQSGMSSLKVGWFGNTSREKMNAVYASGSGGTTNVGAPSGHVEEVLTTNTFIVSDAAPAPAASSSSSGGGGSIDVFVLLAALFGAGRSRRR